MKKLFCAVISLCLVLAMAVGASAYTCEDFSIDAIEGYSERTAAGSNVVNFNENVDGEGKKSVNTYNVFSAELNQLNLNAEEFVESAGGLDAVAKTFSDKILEEYRNYGYNVKVDNADAVLKTIQGYDCIVINLKSTLSDGLGNSVVLSQNQAIIPRQQVVIYVTTTTDGSSDSMLLLESAMGKLNITAPETAGTKTYLTIGLAVIGAIVAVIVAVIVLVVVLVVKKNKKKKAKAAQFNYGAGYNGAMPQYPNGQIPNQQYPQYPKYPNQPVQPVNPADNQPNNNNGSNDSENS